MSSPGGGFEVDPALVHDAGTAMAGVEPAVRQVGTTAGEAADAASGAAGEGPLAAALTALAAAGRDRSGERADECRELGQALHDTGDAYQESDATATARLDAVPFGR